ncbi:type II secretory pathway pseudopilin PulG [Catenulispora sp. EB89]|uniref:hypothetical protein n=1 Tax=Catenulispora sp. EB89 TaxID=3156257 RepID=UPI003518334F
MTTTVGAPPAPSKPAARIRGFLTSVAMGAALTAFISGCIAQSVSLVVIGLVLLPAYGLLYALVTYRRRARARAAAAAVVPRTALAMIESLQAVGGESSDIPVRFDLTVAPDDARAYRVEIRQDINLVALPDYRPRGIVVVEYPPDRPLKVRIVKQPTAEWAERAATASLDSAPGPAQKEESPASCTGCLLTLLGLLVGAGAILGLFHTEVFHHHTSAADTSSSTSSTDSSTDSSSTTTTTTVTSDVGTATVGPGESLLDPGALQSAVESVTQDAANRPALTVVIQDTRLTVVFAPTDVQIGGFDPRTLPYARIPALVHQAENTPSVGTVKSWQVSADGATGSVALRIVVTGDKGAATLTADGQGKVLQHSGGN